MSQTPHERLARGRIARFLIYVRVLGTLGFLRYRYSGQNSLVEASFSGQRVILRRGTPDLAVAVSCLVQGEFDELSLFLSREFSGTIIDAGAHIGFSSLALSNLFPSATVIAVEPQSENFAILKKNTSENPMIVPVHGALVGSNIKIASLRDRGTGEVGFTVVREPEDNPNAEIIEQVPAFRLRDLVEEFERVGILKLDIEGGEFEVFTRDAESVRKFPLVVVELHDRIKDGCTAAFEEMSKGRTTHKLWGEKFLSTVSRRRLAMLNSSAGTAI